MTDNYINSSRRIEVLRDSVARRIAAGEVIDRPQAVLRELLDNSIDSGADEILVHIENGGISNIRVTDNGCGMDEVNLKKCFLPHATSKIIDFEDIYSTTTMGFRGEALSSIASCAKLTITSSTSEQDSARVLEVEDGQLIRLEPARGKQGTTVQVKDLFYSMPGRKNFLKSSSAESAQCRSVFIEKALPHVDTAFRYFTEGNLKIFLPATDLRTRVISAYSGIMQSDFTSYFETESDGIRVRAVYSTPSQYRKDRKYIHVFINNRRINDYSLVQAVDYAYDAFLPGGCHPVCFLFLDISPEHVDFNIHPAKREVKFRNLPALHHIVTSAMKNELSGFGNKKSFTSVNTAFTDRDLFSDIKITQNNPVNSEYKPRTFKADYVRTQNSYASDSIFRNEKLDEISKELNIGHKEEFSYPDKGVAAETNESLVQTAGLLYIGQLFNLFLLFERSDDFLIIDQHAAHERIIFNQLSEESGKSQDLLIPEILELEKDEEDNLIRNLELYKKTGFRLEKNSPCVWQLTAVPSLAYSGSSSYLEFFQNTNLTEEELHKKLFALISCRSAIMDGEVLDSITAFELAEKVLLLDNPRCPHGRPVVQTLGREQLYKMFGRIF